MITPAGLENQLLEIKHVKERKKTSFVNSDLCSAISAFSGQGYPLELHDHACGS